MSASVSAHEAYDVTLPDGRLARDLHLPALQDELTKLGISFDPHSGANVLLKNLAEWKAKAR